jgi:hypothetical protein
MQLIIDRKTNWVTVNGTAHHVDCSGMPADIAMIRWFDDHGEIHYTNGRTTGLADIFRFTDIIKLWDEAHKASKMQTR